jgi:hypothetical protein
MATSPVEVFDGLIKGLVLVLYDFVRLTIAGLCLPFFKRTRRVWPLVVATDKRLSSLTLLAIWILIVTSFATANYKEVASSVIGVGKNDNTQYALQIVSTLVIVVFIDISIRATFSRMPNHLRRGLYESIARIAIANIFLGMFVVLAVGAFILRDSLSIFGPVEYLFWGGKIRSISISSPYLLLFSGSLAIVVVKAFSIRDWRKKAITVVLVVVLVPSVLLNATLWLFVAVQGVGFNLSRPAELRLEQKFTHCKLSDGQIRVTGLLKINKSDPIAIDPHNLAIMSSSFDSLGRGNNGQTPIVFSSSSYIPYSFSAALNPKFPKTLSPIPPEFDCRLGLLKPLFDDAEPVIELNESDVAPSP